MTVTVEPSTVDEDGDYTPPEIPAAVMKTRGIIAAIGTVFPHPANPRKDLGDLAELEHSIYEQGILQPPIALAADRVIAAWPQYADDLAGAEWVILMGHRRRAARFNVVNGDVKADLEILVREDVIADDPLAQLDAMIAENVSRKAMEPVEESRAFAEQVAAGRSQRTIAAKAGCSQGHVSKRLGLLKLPAVMLAAVESNDLSIKDALSYLEAAAGDPFLMLTGYKLVQERRARNPVDGVEQVRRELDQRAKTEAAEKKLADEGVKIVDPGKKFGNSFWQHELRSDKAVAAAKKAGTLVAAVGYAGRVSYYSTELPNKADNRTENDEARLATERAARKAKAGRDTACAQLVAAAPTIADSGPVRLLVGAVLASVGSDSAKLAMRWLAAAGTVTDATGMSPYQFGGHVLGKPWPVQAATAYALSLAQREMSARNSYHTWGPADAAYLQLLATEVGYVPTGWEQAKLDAITGPGTTAAESTTYTLGWSTVDGWCLHVGDNPAPYDSAGADIGEDDFASAQRWATESVEFLGHQVASWTPGLDLYEQDDGFTAVLDDDSEDDEDEDEDEVDQDVDVEPGEYRLRFIDDVWVVMHGDEHLGDNDSIAVDEPDAACLWANDVVDDDCGQRPRLWQTRSTSVDFADVEYVAESGPGISIIA